MTISALTARRRVAKRWLLLALLLLFGLSAASAAAASHLGVRLPAGSRRVEPDRFQSGLDFEATLAYLRKSLRGTAGVTQAEVLNLPQVRMTHVSHADPTLSWEGINVSEIDGKVYLFFLRRATSPAL